MKKILGFIAFLTLLTSCNVTETITFTEDGSGEFLVSYDMGDMMKEMKNAMGGNADSEEKKTGKVMDTTMVFSDIMETYKDSIATLSEDKQLAFESVKDMFMEMHMDEDAGVMNMGIGMKFSSIEELKNIQEKIKKAQSLNSQNGQVDMMKSQTPLESLSGGDENVTYDFDKNGFTRTTSIAEKTEEELNELESLFNGEDEKSNEFLDYFETSYYNVKLVFPRKVKSVNIKGAKISNDGKTVTYNANWVDYIKNPQTLDIAVKFYE